MEHSEVCLEAQKAQSDWLELWPDSCASCAATGYLYDPGVRYYADGSGQPPSYDPCECLSDLRCPRCAEEDMEEIDDGMYHCTKCGWDERSPDTFPEVDCWCHEKYIQEEELR